MNKTLSVRGVIYARPDRIRGQLHPLHPRRSPLRPGDVRGLDTPAARFHLATDGRRFPAWARLAARQIQRFSLRRSARIEQVTSPLPSGVAPVTLA